MNEQNGASGIPVNPVNPVNTANPAPYPAYIPKVKPKCTYTSLDRVYALTALIVGFIALKSYITATEGTGLGLMASIAACAVTLFNFFYCRSLKMRGSLTTSVIFIINLVLSLSFFVCDNGTVTMLCAAMIFFGNAYFSYASYREKPRSVIVNAWKALISPFYEYGALWGAIFEKRTNEGGKKSAEFKKALPVIAGVLLSIPVCIVVIALLGSADDSFRAVFSISFRDLGQWLEEHIIENLFMLLFSLPVSMYIFAAGYSRSYKRCHEGELDKNPPIKPRILPPMMCAAFLSPLTLIYIVFTVMQAVHAFSASVLRSPDFTYSEYARSGFFQLCAVVLINLAVTAAIMFFTKHENKRLPRLLKGFIIAFSLLTHCLIVTALWKMILYISIYGMTPKRVQTSVFMIYLFVMFIVLIVKLITERVSFTRVGYCLAAAVLATFSFVPIDAMIARYNIAQYERGNIPWMGVAAMQDLDAGAIPVIASITEGADNTAYSDARFFLHDERSLGEQFEQMTAWDLNIPRYFAGKAIASANEGDDFGFVTSDYPELTTRTYTAPDGTEYESIYCDGRYYIFYGGARYEPDVSELWGCFAVDKENGKYYFKLTNYGDFIAAVPINGDGATYEFYRAADTIGKSRQKPPFVDWYGDDIWVVK